jgi:hypothetical protein
MNLSEIPAVNEQATTRVFAEDWLLVAIAAGGAKGLTPVQLQKAMFLLGKEMPDVVGDNFYTFDKYNYGPFSRQVYRDADTFVSDALVVAKPHGSQPWSDYLITPDGLRRAEEIKARAPKAAVRYVVNVVAWAQSLSFPQLVRAIYRKYPEYRENSVFNG